MKVYQKPVSALTSCLYILQICLLLLPCIILPSCIMTTTVQEIEDTVTSHSGHCPTKGENLSEGLLAIQIKNNAETVMLQMDSMEICNIQVADATGNFVHNGSLTYSGSITLISAQMQLHYGADTTTTYYCSGSTSKIIIPAQELTPWNTYEHPSKSKNTYVKIHGTLYSDVTNNKTYTIYAGTMYYPISGTIPATSTNISLQHNSPITITIQPYCPLYAILNGTPEKVLQPITFSVTVEDWE